MFYEQVQQNRHGCVLSGLHQLAQGRLEPQWAAVVGWYQVPTRYPELERASAVGFRTANFSLGES